MDPHAIVPADSPPPRIGDLIHDISRDVRTIAVDELELTRNKIAHNVQDVVAKASMAMLGAAVGLIGLAMLCTAAVAGLAGVLPQLWLRLLIMAAIYIVLGAAWAAVFAARIRSAGGPDLSEPLDELKQTVASVQRGLSEHGARHAR